MPTTTIPINPTISSNDPTIYLRRKSEITPKKNKDNVIVGCGKEFIRKGTDAATGIGLPILKVAFGLFGLIGGAVSAALFKENTAADWLSKALMIGGAILGALGVKNLMSFNKNAQSNVSEPAKTYITIDEALGKVCIDAVSNLSIANRDPQFKEFDISNLGPIRTNEANPEVRKAAIDLLKAYIDPKIVDILKATQEGNAPSKIIIRKIDSKDISLAEYRDRIATLVGYISASTPAPTPTPTDPESEVKTLLDSVLNNTTILPAHGFVEVYSISKWYENNKDSIKNLIGGKDKIELLKNSIGKPLGKDSKAFQYLKELQSAQNSLGVLDLVIKYVLNPENLTDPIKARNVIILRQALICGLGLKDKKKLDEIQEQLRKILEGDEAGTIKGIQKKLGNLKDYFDSPAVTEVLNNDKSSIIRTCKRPGVSSEKVNDDLIDDLNGVLADMDWYEISIRELR